MLKFALLFVLLFVNSCGGLRPLYIKNSPHSNVTSREISVYIDSNFGEADKLSIGKSIEQWNWVLNGHIRLRVISYNFNMNREVINRSEQDDSFIITKIDSMNPMVHDSPGKITLAWVDSIGGHYMWIIRDRLANEQIEGVLMHEFGHMLGSNHVAKSSLMCPVYNPETYKCIDAATAYNVAKYNNIEFDKLNYCLY